MANEQKPTNPPLFPATEVLEIRSVYDIPMPGNSVMSVNVTDPKYKHLNLSMTLHRAGVHISAKDFWAIVPYAAIKFIRLSGSDE